MLMEHRADGIAKGGEEGVKVIVAGGVDIAVLHRARLEQDMGAVAVQGGFGAFQGGAFVALDVDLDEIKAQVAGPEVVDAAIWKRASEPGLRRACVGDRLVRLSPHGRTGP